MGGSSLSESSVKEISGFTRVVSQRLDVSEYTCSQQALTVTLPNGVKVDGLPDISQLSTFDLVSMVAGLQQQFASKKAELRERDSIIEERGADNWSSEIQRKNATVLFER